MSVMRVFVLYLYTKFEVRRPSHPQIWLIFGHGVKRPGELTFDVTAYMDDAGHRTPSVLVCSRSYSTSCSPVDYTHTQRYQVHCAC